jgi:23S rRNA (guanosine2251-2'-O)-methyltransferase
VSREREPRVVFGFHAVLARLRADPASVLEIFVDETRHDARVRDLVAAAERTGVRLLRVPTRRLDGFYGGGRHQGVVARVEVRKTADTLDEVLEGVEHPLLLVLDGVTDPHNLGAVCRSVDGAGATGIVLPERGAARVTPAVCRASAGAVEHVRVAVVVNLARYLAEVKRGDLWAWAAARDAETDAWSADLTGGTALVFGAEGTGVRPGVRRACDGALAIPLVGSVESLNVSVAAGIMLFEAARQRHGLLALRPSSADPGPSSST